MSSEKLQVLLKFDTHKDDYIYDMIHQSDDRTNLIKNALFYYMHEIESGKVRDRYYPYSKVNMDKFILNKEQQQSYVEPSEIKGSTHNTQTIDDKSIDNAQIWYDDSDYDEESYEEHYEEPYEEEEDNMDDLDF